MFFPFEVVYDIHKLSSQPKVKVDENNLTAVTKWFDIFYK